MNATPCARGREVAGWLLGHAGPGADLRIDSRSVRTGDLFLAVPGRRTDGLRHLDQALERGAAAVAVDESSWLRAPRADIGVPLLPVAGLGAALGAIAAAFYGDPGRELRTIGITGTNGKTSSCQWIAQLLSSLGQTCASLGTLGFGVGGIGVEDETGLTTPDPVSLQRLARRALERGARALALEVSSIGLDQGRVDGFPFQLALFTNLSRDHLDYHADMAAYAAAKKKLFTWPGLAHGVLNLDDETGRDLARELAPGGLAITGYGIGHNLAGELPLARRLRAQAIEHRPEGLRFQIECQDAHGTHLVHVEAPVIGEFNVLNLLGVLGVALECGIPLAQAAPALGALAPPPGRLQRIAAPASGAAPLAIVDYAHTPDAIAKALRALRPLAQARGGRLHIVFGAGGDRDRGKRPAMGAAAAAGADELVLTSDNPRGEDAESIIDQIGAGIPAGLAWRRSPERAAAIRMALRGAAPADVVLIAGKGHEDYQEIQGRRFPFSDAAQAREALQEREAQP